MIVDIEKLRKFAHKQCPCKINTKMGDRYNNKCPCKEFLDTEKCECGVFK